MPLISKSLLDSSSTKMINYIYSLIVLCMLAGRAFCVEPTNMFSAISHRCNFSQVFTESQLSSLEKRPEFQGCQNWTAITSIKSVEEVSDENKNYLRCLLYHESLVYICKDLQATNEYYDLLSIAPKNTSVKDVCNISLSKMLAESQIIHNFTLKYEQCNYLCREMHKGKLVWNTMCAKFYDFNQFAKEIEKNQTTGTNDGVRSDIPSITNNLEEKNKKRNGSEVQNVVNAVVENKNNDALPKNPIQGQIGNVEEKTDNEGQKEDKPSVDTGENKQNVETPQKLEANVLNSSNNNNLTNSKTTIASIQVSQIQDNQEEKPKSDTDLINNLEAPSNNPKLDNQNTAPGQEYDDFEQENPYKPVQENEMKQGNTIIEVDPDNNMNDDDEGVPDRFKAPKVSQLSDRFGYDADISGNSNFFGYFSFTCIVFVIGYVLYHNKQKVVALLVEGRHSRRPQRTRRPNSANYHKLDSNLEEAISSSVTKNPSHVIY